MSPPLVDKWAGLGVLDDEPTQDKWAGLDDEDKWAGLGAEDDLSGSVRIEKQYTPEELKELKDPTKTISDFTQKKNLAEATEKDDLHTKTIQTEWEMNSQLSSILSGMSTMNAAIARIPALTYDIGAIPQNVIARLTGWNVGAKSPDWLRDNFVATYYDKQAESFSTLKKDFEGENLFSLFEKKEYGRAGQYLTHAFLENLPNQVMLIGAYLSGFGGVGLATMGATVAARANDEARDKDIDSLTSTIQAVTKGGFEVAWESAGTMGILKKWGGKLVVDTGRATTQQIVKNVAKMTFHSMLGEGNEEFWTELSQGMTDMFIGQRPWTGREFGYLLAESAEAGIHGIVMGLGATAPGAAVSGYQQGQRIKIQKQVQKLGQALEGVDKIRQNQEPTHAELLSMKEQLREVGDVEVNRELVREIDRRIEAGEFKPEEIEVKPEEAPTEKPPEAAPEEALPREVPLAREEVVAAEIPQPKPVIKEEEIRRDFETRLAEAQKKRQEKRAVLKAQGVVKAEKAPPEALEIKEPERPRIKVTGIPSALLQIQKELESLMQYETEALKEAGEHVRGGELIPVPGEEGRKFRTALPKELKLAYKGRKPRTDKEWRELAESNLADRKGIYQKEYDDLDETLDDLKRRAKEEGIDLADVGDRYLVERLAKLQREITVRKEPRLKPAAVKKVIREAVGIGRTEEKILTEMQALKVSLRAQQRVAREVKRVTRAEVKEEVRAQETRVKEAKAAVERLVKEHLPPAARGKFLARVRQARTINDVIKAAKQIEIAADEITQKVTMRRIGQHFKRIDKSKSIPIEHVQKTRHFLRGITARKGMIERLRRLTALKRQIERDRKAGRDTELGQRLYENLHILGVKNLDEIPTPVLQNILDEVRRVADIGKEQFKTRKKADEMRQEEELEALKAESVPLTERPRVEKPGKKLSVEEQWTNFMHRLINKEQSIGLAITPVDVVFDLLDGSVGYTGANFRIFKKTIDQGFSDYLHRKRVLSDEFWKAADNLKLDQQNFERIGIFAAVQQEGGKEKLIASGLTEQEIDAIKLTANETEMYYLMRRRLDEIKPEISEVMRTVYNREMGEVKNYFSFMTDWDKMSELEIKDRIGDQAEIVQKIRKKNVPMGFTYQRIGGKQRIRLDAADVYMRHIDNAVYLLTVGTHTKRLSDLAASTEYGEAVGERGQIYVRDWMDLVARKGRARGDRVAMIDWLRRNVGMAVLGFKLSSAMVQPTALLDGAALIGHYAFDGAYNIATNKEWRKFLRDNFAELRERGADDPAYIEFSDNKLYMQGQKYAFWALQKLDLITASAIVAGAYERALVQKGKKVDFSKVDKDAVQEAQLILRRSQASAFFKDAPAAITRGKLTGNISVDRAILQFQNFMLNRWSLVRHDMWRAGLLKGKENQAMNIAIFLALANLAEYGLRTLSRELLSAIFDEDFDTKDPWQKGLVATVIGNVPFLGQVYSSWNYGSIPIPSIDMARKLSDRFQWWVRAKKPDTKKRNLYRMLLILGGVVVGVPGTVQAEQIITKKLR